MNAWFEKVFIGLLTSKKFTGLLIGVALRLFGPKLGLGPDDLAEIQKILLTWLAGQSTVDAVKMYVEAKTTKLLPPAPGGDLKPDGSAPDVP